MKAIMPAGHLKSQEYVVALNQIRYDQKSQQSRSRSPKGYLKNTHSSKIR
jgi:hypothetical protein